jgi:hypothetical protein
MIGQREIFLGVLLPLVISGVIAGVAGWRGWVWLLPLAAGGAFFVGYAAMVSQVRVPPVYGSDWLMWLAPVAGLVGGVGAILRRGWLPGALAGVVALVVVWPLPAESVSARTWWLTAAGVAVGGGGVVAAIAWSSSRVPAGWAIGTLAGVLAGAGVLVMSSHFRDMGVYGLSAAVSVVPAAFAGMWIDRRDREAGARATRGVAVYAVAVLAGVLAAGRFYAEPGITWGQFVPLLLSPGLMALGAVTPGRRAWVRGVIAITVVGIVVAGVALPAALKAKRAAESGGAEGYESYRSYPE